MTWAVFLNIAVAEQLGFKTIWFESPEQLERELNRLGLLTPVAQE